MKTKWVDPLAVSQCPDSGLPSQSRPEGPERMWLVCLLWCFCCQTYENSTTQVSFQLIMDVKKTSRVNGKRELLNGHCSMVLRQPLLRSPVPFLSDANDAYMNNINLPFSVQIFELQAAANALTSRIVQQIQHQSPGLRTANGPMVQKLHEDQRRLWNTIRELERKKCLSKPFVVVCRHDPERVTAFENEIDCFSRLFDMIESHIIVILAIQRSTNRCSTGFNSECHFATPEIADKMRISLPTLCKWRGQYTINSSCRSGSMGTTRKHIFTGTQKETIAGCPLEHFLIRHLPLTVGMMQAIPFNRCSETAHGIS
jgi:hypothetical protein